MNNPKQAKFEVHQLATADQTILLNLLQNSPAAQQAGLKLMADQAVQQWAIQNWLQQNMLYGIWVQSKLVGLIACFPYGEGVELGYFLHKKYQGQHIMTDALGKVLSMTSYQAFYVEVAVTNKASQAVLIHNNFKMISRNNEKLVYRWLR